MTLAVEEVAVLTAASMVMWRESAVAAAAVAVRVVVVVEGRVLIVVDRGTFRGSAPAAGVAVEGLAAAAVVALGGLEVAAAAAAVVEVTASIVGSKGTSLGNVLAVQLLDS